MGASPMREQPTFQRDLGLHTMALQSARLLAHDAYGGAVEKIAHGATPEERLVAVHQTRAASSYVVRTAKKAIAFAYHASGSHGMRNPSRLQRCFRDIYVGCAHMVFDDRNYHELAKTYLDVEPAPF